MIRQGPKSAEEKLARAILAQEVARCLRNVVAGYRLPHPRLRQRAIGRMAMALDCSAMTVERLEREGATELRTFDDLEVVAPPALWDVWLGAAANAAEQADARREQLRVSRAAKGEGTPAENEAYRLHHEAICRGASDEETPSEVRRGNRSRRSTLGGDGAWHSHRVTSSRSWTPLRTTRATKALRDKAGTKNSGSGSRARDKGPPQCLFLSGP
jgi:hypothetical protein